MMSGHESLVCIFRCFLSFPWPTLEKEPVLEVISQVVEPSGESLMLLPFLLSTSWTNERRLGSKMSSVKLPSDETVWGRNIHLRFVAYKTLDKQLTRVNGDNRDLLIFDHQCAVYRYSINKTVLKEGMCSTYFECHVENKCMLYFSIQSSLNILVTSSVHFPPTKPCC